MANGAEAMLYEVPETGPLPYSREGGAVGRSWPQGHPGTKALTSVLAYEEALENARALLLEVLRATKAYRGVKAGYGGTRYHGAAARYTAVELTDDLTQRIALAIVGAVPVPE